MVAGNGGLKGAVREVAANVEEHPFVFRTDVKGYYASINHGILMDIVGKYVQDDAVLRLLWGYLRRYVSDGGEFIDITQGISLGCPLSPLMGALFLKPLDDRMAALGCFYVRYMDDWVILAPTRWKLRKAIKATNQVMSDLRVVKHPDKTFIGRVAKGFDFLGYWFSPAGLGIARKTVERMVENMRRLYEQGAPDERIEAYFQRWWRWVKGGISANLQSVIVSLRVQSCSVIEVFWRRTPDALRSHSDESTLIPLSFFTLLLLSKRWLTQTSHRAVCCEMTSPLNYFLPSPQQSRHFLSPQSSILPEQHTRLLSTCWLTPWVGQGYRIT